MSIFPIDISESRTRWCAYNADDARAYAAALTTAGINYSCHYAHVPESDQNPKIEQWTFDRTKEGE